VFTHIDEHEEAWLEEVSRVLRPDGIAFLTIHPERAFLEQLDSEHFPFRATVTSGAYAPYTVKGNGVFLPEATEAAFAPEMLVEGGRLVFTPVNGPAHHTQVFHTLDYIKARWGQFFSVEDVIPLAHGLHQDGIILRKE
jgi:hypothetical protein